MRLVTLGQEAQFVQEVAHFVARLNATTDNQIGYWGTQAGDIAQSFEDFTPSAADNVWVALENEQIIGVFGFDSDLDLSRAWLYGPIVEHDDWALVAAKLWQAVQTVMPASIGEYEIFCSVKNKKCRQFALQQGFRHNGDAAILRFSQAALDKLPKVENFEISPPYYQQFEILHDRLFPLTYYSGRQILERRNDLCKVFVVTQADVLHGYTYVEVDPEFGEGSIDFVGVSDDVRGKGIGVQVMAMALRWMFSFESVSEITLTCNPNNTAALALYTKIGFEKLRTMCVFRKQK